MGVRAFAAIASFAVCAAVTLPMQALSSTLPVAGLGASSICPTPVVSDVAYTPAPTPSNPNPTPLHATPNAASSGTITVTGSNFTAVGCTPSVLVGSATFAQPATTASTLTIALTPANPMPAAASGAVAVLLTDGVGDANSSNAGAVRVFNLVQTPAATAEDLAPVEGSTEHVAGNAFTPFATEAHGGLPGASVVGTYATCFGPPQRFAATVAPSSTGSGNPPSYDRAIQLSAPTTYCDGDLSLGFTAPYFDDPQAAANGPDCGTPQPHNCIHVTVDADPAAPIDVAFVVNSVEPRSVAAGLTVSVGGSGFGPSGRAAIGGTAASVTWSDRSIQVPVLATASTGHLVVQRLTGDREVLDLGTVAVAGSAVPAAHAAAGAAPGSGGSGIATVVPGGGTTSPATAVPSAPPAPDGLTLPGGVNLPFGLGPLNIKVSGNPLVIWLSVATAVLVALGVLVNLEVLRRWLWSISGARLVARWRSAQGA